MNNGTRTRRRPVAADGVTDDVLAIQRLIDDAHAIGTAENPGVVQLGAGTHILSRPLAVKSNVKLRGVGPSTILSNTHEDEQQNDASGGGTQQRCCLFVGNYHPNQRHTAGGSLYHDPLDAVPSQGATTATLTRNSQAITDGDLVVVYFTPDPVGSIPPQCLRRVTAVDGLNITFHPPIEHDTTAAEAAFVSRGRGDDIRIGARYPSHLTENVTIEDLAVSTSGTWIARSACIDGTFQRITVLDSVNLIYVNAFQSCTFDEIDGVFSERMIEIADGGAGNTLTNITGECDDAPAPEFTDASIVLGVGDTLDGFTITDAGERESGHFKIRKSQTITNGTVTITGPLVGNLFQFGQFGSDVDLSNIAVNIDGEVRDDVFRLFEFTDASIDNVDVATGGYATDVHLFRVRDGLSGVTINDVQDANGSVIYQSPATGDEPSKYVFTNCDWLD